MSETAIFRAGNVSVNSRISSTAVVLFSIIFGCNDAKDRNAQMPEKNQQKITALTADDESRLSRQRAVVERHLGNEDTKRKYVNSAGKLGIIRAILHKKLFTRDQTYELQCLGIVLGDAFVQELKMEWVMVEDDRGRDPAIRMPGTSIILFPLTMISKRVERGEEVDVFDLFNRAAAKVEEMRLKGA